MKILFVGQAPSRESDGNPPFTGRCGKFLAEELLGISQSEMLIQHDFVNVLERWPGKSAVGDLFPLGPAREAARGLLEKMVGRTTVLVGNNVARAFGVTSFKYLQIYEMRHPDNPNVVICNFVAIIPHVSGIVRHWNIRGNREAAAKFLRALAAR